MVAPVVVGQHRLAAAAHPVHRPPELARREGDGEILRVVEPLDPEAAADVRRRHPHRLASAARASSASSSRSDHTPCPEKATVQPPVRPRSRSRRAAPSASPSPGCRRARAACACAAASKTRVDLGLVAERPVVGEVARRLGMDRRPALGGLDVHRQLVEVDDDRLGRVERRRPALGDHQRQRLAGVAHTGRRRGSAARGSAPKLPSRFFTVSKSTEFSSFPARSAAVNTASTPGIARASATSSPAPRRAPPGCARRPRGRRPRAARPPCSGPARSGSARPPCAARSGWSRTCGRHWSFRPPACRRGD